MRILSIDRQPMWSISYECLAPGRRRRVAQFDVLRGFVDALPGGLEGLVLTSDLQGVEPSWARSEPRLIGLAVAEELALLAACHEQFPAAENTGIVLAGDLYARPDLDRRGGRGDVRDVWLAFKDAFAWVAGVAGNHDDFGARAEFEAFRSSSGVHFLDNSLDEIDGLRVAGVGGIIGNPSRPFRRSADDFLSAIRRQVAADPDVLVLHEGPDGMDDATPGNPEVGRALSHSQGLIVCGHQHWDLPMAELASGAQVLNVDARAILLVARPPAPTM